MSDSDVATMDKKVKKGATSKTEQSKTELPKAELSKTELSKTELSKIEMTQTDAPEEEANEPPPPVPDLRQDLSIYHGPPDRFGVPTWSLYDPVRNSFFKIGWVEFEILQRWHLSEVEDILKDIAEHTTMTVTENEVTRFINFLTDNQLLEVKTKEQIEKLNQMHQKQQEKTYSKMFVKYFYLRLKLIFPDDFLNRTLNYARPFFTKSFMAMFLFFGMISLYLIGREWYDFESTVAHFFSFDNIAYYFAVIIAAKIFHEFGHAYAAKYYGCRVPTIGVVFIFFWPIFFTDTTDLWKLKSRKPRLVVGVAGVITELMLAIIATFVWMVLDDGPMRNALFFIASFSWLLSIGVNINPFLKFDGYYVLSDLLEVENLQKRSFDLAKWKIRSSLLGMEMPVPEQLTRTKLRILLTYAFACWIFRLFLYSSIAYTVYTFFFKLAGIIIMASILWIMMFSPILKELQAMWKHRENFKFNKSNITFLGLIAFTLFILFVPWHSYTRLPAVLDYAERYKVFVQEDTRIKEFHIKEDQIVTKDELLLVMDQPEVTYNKSKVKKEIDILKWRLDNEKGNTEKYKYNQASQVDLDRKIQEYKSFEEKQAQFIVKAPFDGYIKHVIEGVDINSWIPKGTLVAEVISTKKRVVRAYIEEQDLTLVEVGMEGRFFPENLQAHNLDVKLIKVDEVNTEQLEDLALATQFGGEILTENINGEDKFAKPSKGIFKLTFEIQQETDYPMITRGKVALKTQPTSIMRRIVNRIQTILIRESGF